MSLVATDIVIPVWNGPVETRECLAALVEHAPDARLILLDAGGDPETGRVLHEFAEYLDDRVILLRTGGPACLVDTLNRGLALASAPLVIALRTSSFVTSGWLEPLQAAALGPDAGVLVPCLAPAGSLPRPEINRCDIPAEACRGSFTAIGITSRLYREIGGFDGGLDGAYWCLRDYSRRAWQAGFRTLAVEGPPVLYRDRAVYGSPERRERILWESMKSYRDRWGEEHGYCFCLAQDPAGEAIDRIFAVALEGARRGERFFVLAPSRTYRTIAAAGLHRLHEHIVVERLSHWFPARALRSAFSAQLEKYPDLQPVTGAEGLCAPGGVTGIPFAELERNFTRGEV